MSSNLYIEPYQRKKQSLDKDLKYAMKRNNQFHFPCRVDESNLSYFIGLRDADLQCAQLIIDFIERYGECEITEEY